MMMRRRSLLVIPALLLAAGVAGAHDLFLKLDTYHLLPNRRVRVQLLNGTFTESENAVKRDRLRELALVTGSGVDRPGDVGWRDAGDTTFFFLTTGAPGTYVAGVSLEPTTIRLDADDFNEYLRHDGIPDVLEARTREGTLDRPARERYAKHVKAIFQVGARRTSTVTTRLGFPAEIVPRENPYALKVGGRLTVECLVDGAPVPDQTVIAGRQIGSRTTATTFRTTGDGTVRIPLDGPGKWYVKFIHMVPVTADTTLDYESKWASLTFEIRR